MIDTPAVIEEVMERHYSTYESNFIKGAVTLQQLIETVIAETCDQVKAMNPLETALRSLIEAIKDNAPDLESDHLIALEYQSLAAVYETLELLKDYLIADSTGIEWNG